MPHSRCNLRRCVMYIWKANHEKRELSEQEILPHPLLPKGMIRHVALSGGEARFHRKSMAVVQPFQTIPVHISLLSTEPHRYHARRSQNIATK